jgi:hypothetical protein
MKNIILTLVFLINLTISFGQNLPENCEYARKKYLEANQDVKNAKMDPWVHYEIYGKKEGRIWYSCNKELVQENKELTTTTATSTTPASTPIILGLSQDKTTGCKFYTYNSENRYGIWNGTCKDGLIDGSGILRLFEGDSLILISNCTYIGGYRNGESIDSFVNGTVYYGNYVNGLKEGKGKMVYSDGGYYDGDWKNGEHEGKGKMVISVKGGGGSYEGDWKNGKMEGNGRLVVFPPVPDVDSMVYTGIFRDRNMIKGKEIWYSKDVNINGGTYEGEGVFMGLRSGIFTVHSPNGQVFSGEYKNGDKYKGKTTYTSGDIHDGELNKDGSATGQGTYFWKDGQRFNGEFKEGKINGQGTLTYINGDSYEGNFKNGIKEGKGKMVYSTGDSYDGDWKNDKYEGKGKYVYSDGDYYVGDFKNGMSEGKGKEVKTDGGYYDGEWKNDKKEGKGKIVKTDGTSYYGDFKNGKFEGNGKFVSSDGGYYDGEWKNGEMAGKGTVTDKNGKKYLTESGNIVTQNILQEEMNKAISFATKSTLGTVKSSDCYRCKGTGIVKVCPICSKRGKVHCKECKGSGFDRNYRKCLNCSGSGITRCHACNGKIYNIKCQHTAWQF